MFELIAVSFALSGEPGAPVCYAPRGNPGEHVLVVAKAANPALSAKGLRQIDCPEELAWSAEAALAQCRLLAHYDEDQQAAYALEYGLSPNEVCDNGREAAGLPVSSD